MTAARKFPEYTDAARTDRARRHALIADKHLDIRGKRVLEIGCHWGDTSRILADEFGCEVVGVDIRPEASWDELNQHPSITLLDHDITQPHSLLAENSFDCIVSFVVWEHILHPWKALNVCRDVLKPDGKKFLRANLYRSSMGSHLYRRIPEPWPHLLYSPDEIAKRLGVPALTSMFWINKLTYQQYLFYFRKLGFYITHESFDQSKHIEGEFFHQHRDRLDYYPEWDLKTEFFNVVLEFDKDHPKEPIPDPVYRV